MITRKMRNRPGEHALTKAVKLSVYGDVINLVNQRGIINVDDEYTYLVVNPIAGGRKIWPSLRTLGMAPKPIRTRTTDQPTAFQSPLYPVPLARDFPNDLPLQRSAVVCSAMAVVSAVTGGAGCVIAGGCL